MEQHPHPIELPDNPNYTVTWNEALKGFEINLENGKLLYIENFLQKRNTTKSEILNYFLKNDCHEWQTSNWKEIGTEEFSKIKFKNIKWKHEKIKLYGKEVYVPRYSAWYGDEGKSYTYSCLTMEANRWNEGLFQLKEKIEKVVNTHFNSVLLNWYRDGEDYMSWHSDDEKELGQNPIIASINFGASRRFLLRRKDDEKIKVEIPLKHNTLLVMKGELQHFWKHAVPKEKKIKEHRINLTFRVIKN